MLTYQVESNADSWKDEAAQIAEENRNVLTAAKEGEARYAGSRGWVKIGECAPDAQLERILRKAGEIRRNADAFVLIGVGGSNNAARSVIEALSEGGGPRIIYAGNTLHPKALEKVLAALEGKDFYVNCIAKNFETLEPGASFRLLRDVMGKRYGADAAKRIICTGTRGSLLYRISEREGYDFFDFPSDIGGRFTAITNVGLLPMAVAGIDIRSLVRGAADMERELFEAPAPENAAYRYAVVRNTLWRRGYRMEMLSSFDPRFVWFYKWWEQLFAESEGKEGKGIFPISGAFSEELHSIGQFLQEGTPIIFETFLDVKDSGDSLAVPADTIGDAFDYLNEKDFSEINRAAMEATVAAHAQRLPAARIAIDRLDAYHFGQLFYFFEFACCLSCGIMGVNPFNQPGVEAYKERMFAALGKR